MTNLAPFAGLSVRFEAEGPGVTAAIALRAACFGVGADRFDAGAVHLVVRAADDVVATLRVTLWPGGAQAGNGYCGTQYDMTGWHDVVGPIAEVGRLCLAQGAVQADVFRLIWGAMAGYVAQHGVSVLFGCATFEGMDPEPYLQGFGWLRAEHLGPAALCPGALAREVIALEGPKTEAGSARAQVPAVLRSYLALGAWVGDHVVVDPELETQHVFCALDVLNVPVVRRRRLMMLATQLGLR